jgi:hypothetical protein
MASTYSTDLRLELIGSGEQSGVWGSTTNLNLGSLVEQAVAGVESISITSSNQALIAFFGAVDEARNAVLVLSSSGAANVYVPPVNKVYIVRNAGSFTITMYNSTVLGNTTPAGTGLAVTSGTTVVMFTDGANFYAAGLPTGATTGTGSIVFSNSPTLTGTPLAPTANAGTNTTQIATTAFVLANGLPSGAIVLWSGSIASIPSGWLLCNGSSGTPDLRDRFVVGAGTTYAVNATGGAANVTPAGTISGTVGGTSLTEAQMPKHYHRFITGALASGSWPNGGQSGQNGFFFGGTPDDAAYEYFNYSVGGDSASGSQGQGTANGNSHDHSFSGTFTGTSGSNLPPYYALAYIMKA